MHCQLICQEFEKYNRDKCTRIARRHRQYLLPAQYTWWPSLCHGTAVRTDQSSTHSAQEIKYPFRYHTHKLLQAVLLYLSTCPRSVRRRLLSLSQQARPLCVHICLRPCPKEAEWLLTHRCSRYRIDPCSLRPYARSTPALL